ncbi:ADP-ribosylglycohydrolase family protein [Streptomyces sudanensis]|uniref:ADP-ribosylglycohydrolase family protein n=1 Tax=Streptomyces sudanensis TaxID=436397 RepID=UPI0020CBDE21|nr:ADP-ribosylglycohydrolase family protein [Streptomyces sudanensis]MCQ0002442.1 ADP-ribosylglycohydrolase family protein [Streptomyces sudanensis]
MTAESSPARRFERALASLRGLAVGDALGSQFFVPANHPLPGRRELPPDPWQWTDDTEMACSVLAVLADHGRIDQDVLARSFAAHHDFDRGYGPAVNRMLRLVREGGDWRELAAGLFQGQGSWGNGSAMRIAPLGAWYADDPEEAVRQAESSSHPTHQHREAVAGCMAVAAAAALAAAPQGPPEAADLLDAVVALVPRSDVGTGLRRARDLLDHDDTQTVAAVLGRGRRTSAQDTVPFALWSAARSLGDYERAFWATAQAGGDVDTTCAIVGGVVAAAPAGGPPADWLARTEALPHWVPDGPGRRRAALRPPHRPPPRSDGPPTASQAPS